MAIFSKSSYPHKWRKVRKMKSDFEKIIRNKAKSTITTLLILTMLISTLTIANSAQAQTTLPSGTVATNLQEGGGIHPLPAGANPDYTTETHAFLSFRPNPVGVNQVILVNLWVTPAIHVSRYFKDFQVTITMPNGEIEKVIMDSYRADGTAWFEWIVDQVGEWKIKFDFPGAYYPAGNYTTQPGAFGGAGNVTFPTSAWYKPSSSPERTLIVQEEIVPSWPESKLPTDYWTRPVHVENREWWTISGNWPATGYVGGDSQWDSLYPDTNTRWSARHKFTPWVQGPESAHIVWKRQGSIAGLIGGQAGQYGLTANPGTPNIVYAGRVYETITKVTKTLINGTYYDSPASVWRCYDLRTGEIYWEQTGITNPPTLIEYTAPSQSEVPGAEAAGTWSVNLMFLSTSRIIKYNPWTGAVTANVSLSITPSLSSVLFYRQPSARNEFPLVLSIQDMGVAAGADRYRLINWTTSGTSTNFATRIHSNTTYQRSSLPTLIDFESGYAATVSGVSQAGVFMGMNLTGIDLWTGRTLWSKNISEPVYSGSCDIVDHGTLAVLSDRGYYVGTDLATGAQKWVSDTMHYPWTASGFGGYSAMSAYGMFFRESYDGIYAFNWTTGKIMWHYEAPAVSQYETPYTGHNDTTVYPFYSFGVGGIIADGKFYTWTYEHTESWPVTRGWGIHAIDVFTGKGVWNLTGCMIPRLIADGYLIGANSYDGYLYFIGKGESKTTVTATPSVNTKGASVLIQGTVLDQSPAQPGTPCVSEASMKTQMDYLHMQLPIDGVWHKDQMTGVNVVLTAIDQNGNPHEIGIVTTSAYYGTYEIAWTPPIEGTYKIIASFEGDASYSSSGASTSIAITAAPETTPAPTQVVQAISASEFYTSIAVVAAGIIIAVVLVGVLILRKRP
jgi:hypothetical protein